MAYNIQLRKKILEYIKKGHSARQDADVFSVSKSTIYEWVKRKDLTPILNHTKGYKLNNKKLEEFIRQNQDIYGYELAEKFNVAPSSMSEKLKKIGYTNKKNSKICRSRQEKKN